MSGVITRRRALNLILLLGVVSLLGDITYEGARSISGPYLALLGAGAAAVGIVAGLGEFFGYAFRTVAGYLADRLRSYWLFTFLGYASLLAIPALALVGHWPAAAALLTLERIGKGLRTPARDAIVSHAASHVGRGFGFGLHEALDQVGALIGPLLFTVAIVVNGDGGYQLGFLVLLVPVALALLVLGAAWHSEPEPERLEIEVSDTESRSSWRSLSHSFWRYTVFSALAVAGFAQFPLIAYHLGHRAVVAEQWIPLLYAVAMGVDGVVAIVAGIAYDRSGLASLLVVPLLTGVTVALAFTTDVSLVVMGVVLWGIVMGLVETNMRAAVGDLSPAGARGLAYGIFNTVFGLSWLIGGAAMGWLYQFGVWWVVAFAGALELLALVSFLWLQPAVLRRPSA